MLPAAHRQPVCRNPSMCFLPSWNCIRARSSSAATNRVCCFCRQRAVHKAFACPKSRFLSTPPPSPFHLPGMNLFIFPSSWNESLHPALIHPARSALSDLPPSQPNIPFIEPPAAPFLKISTRPGRARAGFFFCISSSAGIFHLFPAVMRTPSRSHFQKSGIQNALLLPLFPSFLTSQNTKNSGKLFACRCLCVGVNLSSQAVSSQVLSAPVSLTSVFGMGTGGPSL